MSDYSQLLRISVISSKYLNKIAIKIFNLKNLPKNFSKRVMIIHNYLEFHSNAIIALKLLKMIYCSKNI